jgi:hypothetical protein
MGKYAWGFVFLLAMPAQAAEDAVAVLDIQGTGIDEGLLPTLTEILSVEINELGLHKVIAGRDIQSMLGFEQQKDVLGCTDASCLAEIGGALGVDRIVASHVGKVGSTYVVNIKLINIRLSDTEARVYETVKGEADALIETIRKSVHKLFKTGKEQATAPPPAPKAEPAPQPAPKAQVAEVSQPAPSVSRSSSGGPGIWPWVAIGVGSAAIVGGALAGMAAKKDADEVADLDVDGDGDTFGAGAQPLAESAKKKQQLANVLYGVGVIGVGVGVVLYFMGGSNDGVAVAPIVTGDQVGLAGAFSF